MDAVERITRMEEHMDKVRAALDAVEAAREPMAALLAYYEGGAWRQDYEQDEAGALPSGLKRGVLSEDGLYNLLCDWEQTIK